ncbi:MAG: hypothetical protein KJZ56_11335 [Flavobacteriales bacterium]|nr:hypothetical protein [Flavobacteriales bacterium]
MKNYLFIVFVFIVAKGFSQNPKINIYIDSLTITDTIFRTSTDYKINIGTYVDFLSKRKRLGIAISELSGRVTYKIYDSETMTHIETRTYQNIKGELFHNGPYYLTLEENYISYGTYKMNHLEGIAIRKDSLGQILWKANCNSQKRLCNEIQYFNNGNIKAKYQTIEDFYSNNYTEFFQNGKVKISGKYKLYKTTPKKTDHYYSQKLSNYESGWHSETEGYFSVKTGIWEYYNEDGSLMKKEKYDNYGKLLE